MFLFLAIALVAFLVLLRRAELIGVKTAKDSIENGALLVDVRTPDEFNSSHLPNAMNIPLSGIEHLLPARIHDKNRVLLMHCESGVRSAIARRKAKSLGYPNAFNLGSHERAKRILSMR
jgi:phage shock protein E